ncbi:MAG: hypothetical protein ACOCTG_02625 [Bacteroidota bacterium]
MQRTDVTTHAVRFVVIAACEGKGAKCQPSEAVWSFETGQQVAQFLGSDELVLIDGEYQAFESSHYRGPMTELTRSPNPQFRIPFDLLQEIAAADDVRVLIGGNAMRFSDRRRDVIRDFIQTVRSE